MKQLHKKALQAYLDMLEIHIDTKTSDIVFHKETEEFYKTLFEVAHLIWERYVDLDGKLTDSPLNEKKNQAYTIISDLLKEIEAFQSSESLSLWTDDLIGWLADQLEDIKWTAKGFVS